jgi:uncharacterized protein DUF4124
MYKFFMLSIYLLLHFNIAYSEVYKWVDENGKTVYGDKPSSDEADIIKINKKTTQDKHYKERQKKQKKLLDVMQEEREEKIANQNKEKEELEKKKQKCLQVKKELIEIKNASFLYEKTNDPDNPKIYSNEQRKIEEESLEQYIKDNC